MWFGEPHPFPERGSPTRLSASGQESYEGWSCRIGQYTQLRKDNPLYTMQENHNIIQGNTTQYYTMKSFDPGFNLPSAYLEYFLGVKAAADNRTVTCQSSLNLGASTTWNPLGQ